MFSTALIVSGNHGNALLLILIPYFLMLGLLHAYINKQQHPASLISYFLAVTIVCIVLNLAFYEVSSNPGASSTSGLVYLIAPVYSIFLLAIFYIILTWLIGLVVYKYNDKGLRKITLIITALILVRLMLPFFMPKPAPYEIPQREEISSTKGDILKAKKLRVFVKDLRYTVDSFTGPVNFSPYIEKAFKYVDEDDSTKIEVSHDRFGSYFISFQENAVGDGILETVNFHECAYMPCLRKPELKDTIIFNIRRYGYVVGKIRVWE